jgi:serine/threonine-protein kinase
VVACGACSKPLPESASFCPACGTSVGTGPAAAGKVAHKSRWSSSALDHGAFAPGQVLGDRYRVIGLLGRGGMGEVYRADDLTLGLPVALKFLPTDLETRPRVLERFLAEVRNARQVSHPYVCRVHDIGEADGRHFLSMEFVDGEDLASLLHRIGQLPEAKALEIARQLCAGLQAAHDRGVVHRDLKPANVMIDGEGRARITDFGLAVSAGESKGELAGTPAYIAPEQFAGGAATARSDIYALGLVLHKVFTGVHPFEATTFEGWRDAHVNATVAAPRERAPGLDPRIERVILQCLAKEPERRPRSAAQVSAALPGGDPIAMALAAGQTPSPEMIAAAGGVGALSTRAAAALLAVFLALVVVIASINKSSLDLGLAPMRRSPDGLRDRARELVDQLGLGEHIVDTATTLERDYPLIRWLADNLNSTEWRRRMPEIGTPVLFFFRASPQPIRARNVEAVAVREDRPLDVPELVDVTLDGQGRLRSLIASAPAEPTGAGKPIDWSELFRAAGLELARFEQVEASVVPPLPFDQRVEWTGTRSDLTEAPLRVSGASWAGRLAYFTVLGPWEAKSKQDLRFQTLAARVSSFAFLSLRLAMMIGLVFFASRNLRLGRGDRRGAWRVAAIAAALSLVAWSLTAHFASSFEFEEQVNVQLALALFHGGSMWLAYIAIEPFARRRAPDLLIGWARLLEGRLRDARVARDVLIGLTLGALVALCTHVVNALPTWIDIAHQTSMPSFVVTDGRGMWPLGSLFSDAALTLTVTLYMFCTFLALELFLRKRWLAGLALALMMASINLGAENPRIEIPGAVFIGMVMAVSSARFGLLTLAAMGLAMRALIDRPLGLDFSLWYTPAALAGWAPVVALAVWAFRTSRGRSAEPG